MRAVLITNPSATTSAGWSRDVLTRALEAELDLTTFMTEYRGHATEIAEGARATGVELIITLGGDGTINEAINGMLFDTKSTKPLPLLATIPGGLANVFPRALGYSSDAMAATGQLLEALTAGSTRKIPLGQLNDRWFAFAAGIGLDAGIVEAMEVQRAKGAKASPARYFMTGIRQYLEATDRTTGHLTIRADDGRQIDDAFMLIIQNTTPWTFIGPVPLDFSTDAKFDRGLDAIALTSMTPASLATYIAEATARIPTARRSNVALLADCQTVEVTSDIPLPAQVDGDSLGLLSQATIRMVKDAISVVSPLTD